MPLALTSPPNQLVNRQQARDSMKVKQRTHELFSINIVFVDHVGKLGLWWCDTHTRCNTTMRLFPRDKSRRRLCSSIAMVEPEKSLTVDGVDAPTGFCDFSHETFRSIGNGLTSV
jgi:hypothetical protein